MNSLRDFTGRLESLLDKGNDLTSIWGPLRRTLPPRDVKLGTKFIALYSVYNILVGVFGTLAVLILSNMFVGRRLWYAAVAAGHLSVWSVASYYASWLTHRFGFILFYFGPALVLACVTLSVVAWNRRARRWQEGAPLRESQSAPDNGVWPPPPTNRKQPLL